MATAAKAVAADSTKNIAPTPAAQQSDNVAHALAGAGGGILSTALTYVMFQVIPWHASHLTKDIL
jgi:adenine nucleotide transporter 17